MTFSSNNEQKPTTRAYIRMSTSDQNTDKNKAEILTLANAKHLGHVEFYEEICSGKVHWRKRQIGEIIDISQRNDCLIVPELSRLGRSMLEVMQILAIATEKGVRVFAIKGDWELNDSIQSKLIAMCFSMASEIERSLIASRTKEALEVRKRQGIKLGRPAGKPGKSKLDQYAVEIQALITNGSSQRFIAKRYNTTEANLFHWMRKHNIQKPTSQNTL